MEILALYASKATQSDDMLIKKLSKIIPTFFLNFSKQTWIKTSTFPEQLKYADVKPAFKRDYRTDKKNYRPISTLSNVSKV